MFGIGLPDLLFIGLLFLLLVKPADWPMVAKRVARAAVALRRMFLPVLEELRGVRETLMTDATLSSVGGPLSAPSDWSPLPQSHQKGGEPTILPVPEG
jgi:sec-independent protein translocase protein TatB